MKRLGLLTGGGDCPGLNAAIRAVVRRSSQLGFDVYGIYEGFKGLSLGAIRPLYSQHVSGILPVGGTILKSSRFNPFVNRASLLSLRRHIRDFKLDGLIVIGGEGTLRLSYELTRKKIIRCVGIPKTIDNDVMGTDFTLGFHTAVQTATEAIDKLHTTAESHNQVMVLEVMGRHAGWLALFSGLAGGADLILTPEKNMSEEHIMDLLVKRHTGGKSFSIVVVAEDAKVVDCKGRVILKAAESFDHYGAIKSTGMGAAVAQLIKKKTGFESRVVVLGHLQRGGAPVAYDRILATQFGVKAVELIAQNKWNTMVAIQGGKIVSTPLSSVAKKIKKADKKILKFAENFFG